MVSAKHTRRSEQLGIILLGLRLLPTEDLRCHSCRAMCAELPYERGVIRSTCFLVSEIQFGIHTIRRHQPQLLPVVGSFLMAVRCLDHRILAQGCHYSLEQGTFNLSVERPCRVSSVGLKAGFLRPRLPVQERQEAWPNGFKWPKRR